LVSKGQIEHQTEEYRKGQILGFTMAEIMLVILFLLLLLLGSKINKQENALLLLESNTNKQENALLLLESNTNKQADTILILESKINEQADTLSKSYQEDTPEHQAIDKIKRTLSELQNQGLVSRQKDVNWLAERLVLTEAGTNENVRKARELASFIATNENLTFEEGKQCLATCGANEGDGDGPKACWGESLRNPDYIYNVALYDDAIFVTNNFENIEKNKADWDSLLQPARIEKSTLLSNAQFQSRFAKLKEHASVNECEYAVRLVDVFTSSKAIYKKQRQLVEGYVYPTLKKRWNYGTLPK
jgi:hypothetical protein